MLSTSSTVLLKLAKQTYSAEHETEEGINLAPVLRQPPGLCGDPLRQASTGTPSTAGEHRLQVTHSLGATSPSKGKGGEEEALSPTPPLLLLLTPALLLPRPCSAGAGGRSGCAGPGTIWS